MRIVECRDLFCVHRTSEGDAAALQGLYLDVHPGEVLCVLGPSGAGKTTLLQVIAGLRTPSAGVVRVLGEDIGRRSDRLRARFRHQLIGFLDQSPRAALHPDLPVGQGVALPLALRGAGRAQRRARTAELLAFAALADRADALPGELSGGECQRVALCAALAHRPPLLLADEPTGELDELAAQAVCELLRQTARTHGTTVIVVSHEQAVADAADRAVTIRDGRIVEDWRDGRGALVIGRGGWVQLPSELLTAAGIRDRARVRAVEKGVIVTAAEGAPADRPPPGSLQRRSGAGSISDPTRPTGGDPSSVASPPTPAIDGLDDRDAPPAWKAAAVELRAAVRSRGRGADRRLVIECLSCTVAPGSLTAVTGRSGAGKTTLLRILAGLDVLEHGELLLDGEPLAASSAERRAQLRRRRIGYLPQDPLPVPFLSATENVVLSLALRGWSANAAGERATVVLARLGLEERSRQRVWRLSAGERQRVALARALASARGLLIVDEPTSRLDRANATRVALLLAGAAAGEGQTVICATHDPDVIRTADEIIEL